MSKLKAGCKSQRGNHKKYAVRAALVICLCKFWKDMKSENAVLFPKSPAETIKMLNYTHAICEYTSYIYPCSHR